MRNSHSHQSGTTSRQIISPTDSIIFLPANRLSLEQPQQQNANSSLGIFHTRNIFGPVSYPQLKILNLLKPPKKKLEENATTKEQKVKETEDENANGRHVFLMDNSKNVEEHSQEITETEKADRSLFMRSIMLSILQREN